MIPAPHWSRLARTVAPLVAPVSLTEAKAHLRVDHDTEDDLITSLVDVALAGIEGPNGIGLALVTQTWRMRFDGGFPIPIVLPLGPVQSVASITYVDTDGDTQTLAADQYVLSEDRSPAVIDRAYAVSWPAVRRQLSAVTVTFVAGFGDTPSDVPADLRHAMLLMVGHLYHQREAVIAGPFASELPMGVSAILERHRVGRFG